MKSFKQFIIENNTEGKSEIYAPGIWKFTFTNGDIGYFSYDPDSHVPISYSKLHRLDGPAFIFDRKLGVRYRINGKDYTPEEYWKHPDVIAYKTVKDAGGDPRLLDI